MKFNKNKVKPGDRLVLARPSSITNLVFRGMGHDGTVIVRYALPDGHQGDVILLQREVLIPDELEAA